MTAAPAAPPWLLAEVTAAALGSDTPPGQAAEVAARVVRPDFHRWQAAVARARGCTRPAPRPVGDRARPDR